MGRLAVLAARSRDCASRGGPGRRAATRKPGLLDALLRDYERGAKPTAGCHLEMSGPELAIVVAADERRRI